MNEQGQQEQRVKKAESLKLLVEHLNPILHQMDGSAPEHMDASVEVDTEHKE